MLKLFADNRPYVLFVLPLLLGLMYGLDYQFGRTHPPSVLNFGTWGNVELTALNSLLIAKCIGFIANLSLAILLNFGFNNAEFADRNTYFPSFFFLLLVWSIPEMFFINGLHLAILGVILMTQQYLKLNQNNDGKLPVFNGTFFLGISATFIPSNWLILPLIYAAILIFRPLIFREFFLFMLGAALPMLYSYTFAVVQNQTFALFPALDPNSSYHLDTHQVVLSILFAVISLFSIAWLTINSSGKNNRQKKEIQAIYWVYAASLLVCILHYYFTQSLSIALLFFPLAVLFTFPFLEKKVSYFAQSLAYLLILINLLKFLVL